LKKYKFPSSDQIPAKLIQAGAETLLSVIPTLTNSIWKKEELPGRWKDSIIVPVLKEGDKMSNNYRGMSLLSTSYKIVSNIILSRLSSDIGEVIGDQKCGF
jgi:hypothetical protein